MRIPKRLRIYFLYDRKLLAKLSICGWKVISAYLKSAVPYDNAVPGASIAVQTYAWPSGYGDFQNYNPHLHAIVSNGCFMDDDSFQMAPGFMLEDLEEAFQKVYEVNPLICKKCQGPMKIISFIEEIEIIEMILRHPGLWDIHNHDPPPLLELRPYL